MNKYLIPCTTCVCAVLAVTAQDSRGTAGQGQGQVEFTEDFGLEYDATFSARGANLYFSIQPGTFWRYEGEDDGEFIELEISVLSDTKHITFNNDGAWTTVKTRVIEEREWVDGELVEVSRNFFARRVSTGDIFYFGEDVDIYEDGEIVSHDGAWLAGVDGAEPGVIMPGLFTLGSRYFQEIAPGVALDRAEHAEMDLEFSTPAGDFEDCVLIVETSPLEPNSESIKIYAPGVGMIFDNELELVEYDD